MASCKSILSIVVVALLSLSVASPLLAQSPEELMAAASALYGAQKYSDAAQKLDAFLASSPKHPKAGLVAYTLGRCRSELKQFPLAIPAYEKAIASGTASILSQSQLGLGEAALQTKQYAKAAASLEAAVKLGLKPEQEPLVWSWLGQSEFRLQRFAQAEAAYSKVFQTYPDSDLSGEAYYGAGLSALKLKKNEKAKQNFLTFIEKRPNSETRAAAMLSIAQIDLAAKRSLDAMSEYKALLRHIASNPKNSKLQADAEDGLIQSLLALKYYDEASGRLESAVKRLSPADPQFFRAQLSLGHSRYHVKTFDAAANAFMKASKSGEPEVAKESMYWAAISLLASKKLPEAAEQFLRYVEKYPKDELAVKARLQVADVYYDLKQTEKAKLAYQAVIESRPQSSEANDARIALKELQGERLQGSLASARKLASDKKWLQAQSELAALIQSKPEASIAGEAHYLLGGVYEALLKPALAAVAYSAALKILPDADWSGVAWQNLSWLYLDLKQPANAEKAALSALARKLSDESEIQTRLALTQALLDQEKWDASLEASRVLLEKKPNEETTAAVLAIQTSILEKLAKPTEALAIYERLVTDYPKNERSAIALRRIADDRIKGEKWEEAQKRLSQLLLDFPNSAYAIEARYDLGNAFYHLGKFSDAAIEYDKTADNKGAGDLIPESLYWAGAAYDKAGKKEAAIDRLSKLVGKHPKSEHVPNAKIRLAALKALK